MESSEHSCWQCGKPSPLTEAQWADFDRKLADAAYGSIHIPYACECGFAEQFIRMSFFPENMPG